MGCRYCCRCLVDVCANTLAAISVIIGIFSATLAVVYGVARLPIHRSATILLFELVAGALSAQWLTDEVVTSLEWFGGGLIVIAAYMSVREGRD